MIAREHAERFREPECGDPDVSISMPELNKVRIITERMKNISQCISIAANMSGQLTLGVSKDGVKIQTFFKDLSHPTLSMNSLLFYCISY